MYRCQEIGSIPVQWQPWVRRSGTSTWGRPSLTEAGAMMLPVLAGALVEVAETGHGALQCGDGEKRHPPLVEARSLAASLVDATNVCDVANALQGQPRHALPAYSSAIQRLGRAKRPEAAAALFEWLESAGGNLAPDVRAFNALLGVQQAAGQIGTALEVQQRMIKRGVEADVATYNMLIGLHGKCGNAEAAVGAFNAMKVAGLQPDKFSYRTLAQACERVGCFRQALEAYAELVNGQPLSYEVACCQGGGVATARLGARLEQRATPVMRGMLAAGQPEEVLELFRLLCRPQLQPSADGFRHALLACAACHDNVRDYTGITKLPGIVNHGLVEIAGSSYWKSVMQTLAVLQGPPDDGRRLHLWQTNRPRDIYMIMRERGFQPTAQLCNTVIANLGRGRRWWAALEVFEDMQDQGPAPDRATIGLLHQHFAVLLGAAKRRRLWKWALQLLEKMLEKASSDVAMLQAFLMHNGLEPEEVAWHSVLVTCAGAGAATSAVRVFDQMQLRGFPAGPVAFGALLSAYEKADQLEDAKLLWDQMIQEGVAPNMHAYTTMISAYGKRGQYGCALRVFEELSQAGLPLTVVPYNALISACVRTGDGLRALHILEEMKLASIEPDAISYQETIEALALEGQWKSAVDAFTTSLRKGVKPTSVTRRTITRIRQEKGSDYLRTCQLVGKFIQPCHLPFSYTHNST
eukprot:SM000020S06059  [mRNA]  locus=s20:881356:885072:+ [translate_table: standard]